jgi:hypothetical protein
MGRWDLLERRCGLLFTGNQHVKRFPKKLWDPILPDSTANDSRRTRPRVLGHRGETSVSLLALPKNALTFFDSKLYH